MHPRRGMGFPGGAQRESLPNTDDLEAWLAGRLPDDWFEGAPTVVVDRDEILVVGRVAAPTAAAGDEASTAAAEHGRIQRFREDTREQRIRIAQQAEHRYARKVAWGAACGGSEELFTTLSVPVMTRLRLPERQVLDTLVDASVARSRSDALAWCVRLVAEHQGEWIQQLRDALAGVEEARRAGPQG